MTDMQLIVPPLDDTTQGDDSTVAGNDGNHERHNQNHKGVLSQELDEHFEAMKAIWRQARRSTGEEAAELKRKSREKATETAIAVDAEIQKWQAGIAELEALLAAEEQGASEGSEEDEPIRMNGRDLNAIRFPFLPPVIPPEDDESMGGGASVSDLDDQEPGPEAAATEAP